MISRVHQHQHQVYVGQAATSLPGSSPNWSPLTAPSAFFCTPLDEEVQVCQETHLIAMSLILIWLEHTPLLLLPLSPLQYLFLWQKISDSPDKKKKGFTGALSPQNMKEEAC